LGGWDANVITLQRIILVELEDMKQGDLIPRKGQTWQSGVAKTGYFANDDTCILTIITICVYAYSHMQNTIVGAFHGNLPHVASILVWVTCGRFAWKASTSPL
jgi:hypothetical protein